MRQFRLVTFLFVTISFFTYSQQTVLIHANKKYQVIKGFGGSDAWNCDFVGKYWDSIQKEDIAQYLFSREFDSEGNPKGIGLSRWRFNIGGGSAEQGDNSNINRSERRAECFLNEDGSYNWDKQKGQQYFLNKANEYGVEQLVAFVNSPPRFYTKSGRANSNNSNNYGNTNLLDDHYDEFARFLATVLKHFKDMGLDFKHISPVNEPQYSWNSGQEGCPWKNSEITKLVGELNTAILNNGLATKILVAEAAHFDDLHKARNDSEKSDQIWQFFNNSNPEYLGGYSQVLNGICGHSYWTDESDDDIRSTRENIRREADEQGGIELYQTEYNLLSKHYDDYWKNSLFLAKMLYADLTIAGVSIWDYWTVIERERWSQKNRFYLIRLKPAGGDYEPLENGGTISVDKNLWVYGNYARFIRPGFQRIEAEGADKLSGLMGSAYISPDSSQIVIVYVNWNTKNTLVSTVFSTLPEGKIVDKITPYITDASTGNLTKGTSFNSTEYTIKSQSVVTLLVDLKSGSQPPPPQNNFPFTNYNIINKKSGNILDVGNGSILEGADIVQWNKSEGELKWRIDHIYDEFYKITSIKSDKSLDIEDGSVSDGAAIAQWDYWGGDNQLFKFIDNNDGYYTIQAKHSGKCIDVKNSSMMPGEDVIQNTCNKSESQRWKIDTLKDIEVEYTAINNFNSANHINIYPNPVSGNKIIILLPEKFINNNYIEIEIYSIDGVLVHKKVNISQSKFEILLNNAWKNMVYIVKIKTKDAIYFQKLFVGCN